MFSSWNFFEDNAWRFAVEGRSRLDFTTESIRLVPENILVYGGNYGMEKECPPRHLVVLLCGARRDVGLFYEHILREMRHEYAMQCIDQRHEIRSLHSKKTKDSPLIPCDDNLDYDELDIKYRAECGDDVWACKVCNEKSLDEFPGVLFVKNANPGDVRHFKKYYRHVWVVCMPPVDASVQLDGVDIADSGYTPRQASEQCTIAIELVKRIATHYGVKHQTHSIHDDAWSDDDDDDDDD